MKVQGVVAAALFAIGPGSVWAQESGDATSGLAAARRNCAVCHAIEKGDGWSPERNAPNFEAIGATPGMTAAALVAALHTSHRDRTMPHFILSPEDLNNIVAYILSLK